MSTETLVYVDGYTPVKGSCSHKSMHNMTGWECESCGRVYVHEAHRVVVTGSAACKHKDRHDVQISECTKTVTTAWPVMAADDDGYPEWTTEDRDVECGRLVREVEVQDESDDSEA